LKRLSSTGWMLTKVTSSYRFWSIRSAFLPRHRVPAALDKLHRKNARAFRDISLRHGGAFLKIGQMLSARPDILPASWVEELSTLQDRASCADYDSMRAVIEADLKAPLSSLFSEFNPEPIAAASIGQVYRARLTDGREVAVKVQRPGLEDVIELDLALLRIFAESLRGVLPPTDFDTIVEEIQRSVREELDYRVEAGWMHRIGNLLNPVDGVRVPALVKPLSSKHVLTSEFIVGRKLTDVLDEMKAANDQEGLANLLGRLIDLYLRQVLQAGYFQADPHPGNLLVTASGDLVLLDFGCTAELPDHFRRGYFDILRASVIGDTETVGKTLFELGFKTRSGKPDTLIAFSDALLQQLRQMMGEINEDGYVWPTPDDLIKKATELLDQANRDQSRRDNKA
ncbi:MAG: ABC1 kinase family protein, partial [Halioglobus sp.]